MKRKSPYSTELKLAIKAMNQASIQAREKAIQHKLKIPVWKNGTIEYIDPSRKP